MKKEIKTLQDLREFVEGIPEDQMISNFVSDNKGNGCIIGQLNHHLTGSFSYEHKSGGFRDQKSIALLCSLNIRPGEIAWANNKGQPTPKAGVLKFIDNKIKETI